jgi:hypothetical protein
LAASPALTAATSSRALPGANLSDVHVFDRHRDGRRLDVHARSQAAVPTVPCVSAFPARSPIAAIAGDDLAVSASAPIAAR